MRRGLAEINGPRYGDASRKTVTCATFPLQTKPGWDVLSPRRKVGWEGDVLHCQAGSLPMEAAWHSPGLFLPRTLSGFLNLCFHLKYGYVLHNTVKKVK